MQRQTPQTVLIIDDSPSICRFVSAAIEPLGYEVLTATGGKEALTLLVCPEKRIDVVISDVMMPVIGGVELIGLIHERDPDMPVILMTAFSNINVVITAIKKRAFDLILKPIDAPLLQQAVEKAMKHRNLLSLEKNYLKTLKETVKDKTSELQNRMAELEEARTTQTAEHEKLKKLFRQVQEIKLEWERIIDCIGDMVLQVDENDKIRRCNKALRLFTDKPYLSILGTDWRELFRDHSLIVTSETITSGSELYHAPSGSWFIFTTYPFTYGDETANHGTIITLHDTTELKKTVDALENAYKELQATQAQILHQEKMASIGQLAAGVAHEINNPIGYVSSNLNTLSKYLERLAGFITSQTEIVARAAGPEVQKELADLRQSLKIDHILRDIGPMLSETLDGTSRVGKIVQDLTTFSRVDNSDSCLADVSECLESAINIVWNELKYKATIHRDYGTIPPIHCYPQQLNQVFINLLVNAGHAIEGKGHLNVSTHADDSSIYISFTDDGSGIAPEHLTRIFEPFFTTKEVGKGTGLGLSITYDIIKKHQGDITVESTVGKGTTFTVRLPRGETF
jgi:two-component system, NtrC family, sensor kinase